MARVAPIKTAQQAASNYGTKGGAAAAAQAWAAGYTSDIPAIFAAASAQVGFWQSQVSTPQAATNFKNGLARAANNVTAIAAKVNGVGMASFSAGVKAAAQGNYLAFSNNWQAAVASEVSTAPTRAATVPPIARGKRCTILGSIVRPENSA
jgi:hypothetical protein